MSRLLHHLTVREDIDAVTWAHLSWDGDRADLSLRGFIYRIHIDSDLFDRETYEPCRRSGDQDLIPHLDLATLDSELTYADLGEELIGLRHIDLLLRGRRSIVGRPFTEALTEVIPVPEATIEDLPEVLVPLLDLRLSNRYPPPHDRHVLRYRHTQVHEHDPRS